VQEVLAQISWYHNITLLEKVKEKEKRDWYVYKNITLQVQVYLGVNH